jgi:peptidoglycan hydrolase-like protein with peptidoglycan-binding domain
LVLKSPRFATNERLQKASRNSPALRAVVTEQAVAVIQQALLDLGFLLPISTKKSGRPDGIFGAETVAKIKEFQRKHKLKDDGVVGEKTMHKFDELLPGPPPPPPPAPKHDRRVRLHFRSVAMPIVPEFVALANAQRVYDSINVELFFASGLSMSATTAQLIELDASDGTCKWNQESDEQQLLDKLGGRDGVKPFDIVVYYANSITEKDGKKLNGCAGHLPNKPTVVVSATGTPWTLGHELGHVLLGPSFSPVHMDDDKTNIMHAPTSEITVDPPGFTEAQAKAIRSSKFAPEINSSEG